MYKLIVLLSFLISLSTQAQTVDSSEYSILFYNVENLFDCRHDSLKDDTEFLKGGLKNWSPHRMYQKLNGISKVILASNGWNTPSLIGLCEVENAYVLNQLIFHTGLNNAGYRFIHYESPDKRGIDVALLYKQNEFKVLEFSPVNASDTSTHFYTRDGLYVKGLIKNTDTLHVFVNHWPSKRGGALASEEKRIRVATSISNKIDSIQVINKKSKLIVMGDFNAEYDSPSVQKLVKKHKLKSILQTNKLALRRIAGTHKYQGQWALIDHILISEHLTKSKKIMHKIIELPFLLEDDLSYSGVKPKRTYAGPRYIGGISDHLPVIISIKSKKEGEL